MSFDALRRQFRRATGQDRRPAVLGDADGVIYEPGRPGYVRVRYPVTASTYSAAVVVRMRGVLPVDPGAAVVVGYDADNELAVLEIDFAGQINQGRNPLAANAADESIYGYTDAARIATLYSGPVTTPVTASTDVFVLSLFYILQGTARLFNGERVALAASIPAAGEHLLAGLFLDTTTDTITVVTSTTKSTAEPLTVGDDVQECLDSAPSGAIPVWFWRLHDAQTEITAADSFLDGRPFVNTNGGDHGLLDGLGDDDHLQYSLVNGTRAFTGTVGGITPTASTHLATKEYVDTAVAAMRLEYFLTNTASGIGAYYDALPTPTGEAESTFTTAGLGTGDNQLLTSWITPEPGIDALEVGVYVLHVHAEKTAGTKPVTLYWTMERRTSVGVETTVMTSEVSEAVTAEASLELHANLAADFDLNADDRLVVNVFANVGVTGSDVTVAIYAEGATGSHFEIVTSTGGLLTVEEVDGAPSVSGVRRIVVSNGTLTDDGGGQVTVTTGGGGGAPSDATYITQTANGGLSNEQALSALATGEMIVTTTTGVITSRPHNIAATAPPTVNDDTGDGYIIGSLWIDTTHDHVYRAVDVSSGAAVWKRLSPGPYAVTVRSTGSYTTNSTSFIDVDATNVTITMDCTGRPVMLIARGMASNNTNAYFTYIDFTVDGTRVGGTYGLFYVQSHSANQVHAFTAIAIVTVAAGSRTFRMQWAAVDGGVSALTGDSTNAAPLEFDALEI